MKRRPKISSIHATSAFSLIELLAVIAVAAILITLAGLAINGITSGRNLLHAADMLTASLSQARQTATSTNSKVLWQLVEVPVVGGTPALQFRKFRLLTMKPGTRTWQQIARTEELPTSVWVSPDQARSSLVLRASPIDDFVHEGAPLQEARAIQIVFDSSGRASIGNTENWLTVVDRRGGDDDFITIQIDPVTSRTRTFRP